MSARTYRFAVFNAALNRERSRELIRQLATRGDRQAQQVAAIIQQLRPDVLALLEFDYDPDGQALALFQRHYLAVSQNGAAAIDYPYRWVIPSNTGVLTGLDLDGDGSTTGPNDAFGFGYHPGQFAFAVLSRYPLDLAAMRCFQTFRWTDMPGSLLPRDYYRPAAQKILRLSSKNHIDLPVQLPGVMVHTLIAHPTPPVFDGPEGRNRRRNHDEIRLFADYISPDRGDYLYDDQGVSGGLAADQSFVILGDLNADPVAGDGIPGAVQQLLDHPRIHREVARGALVPTAAGAAEFLQDKTATASRINASEKTSNFGLRVDYALPSADLGVATTGMFAPSSTDPLARLVDASDHRLVWVDIQLP